MRSMVLIFAGLAWTSSVESQPARLPYPSEKDLQAAEKLVRELYGEELAKARDALSLSRLATTFIQEAKETKDYPAGKAKLLELAFKLANQGGDVGTALSALEEAGQVFQSDPHAILRGKVEALQQASRAETTTENYQTMVDHALVLLEETLAGDQFPLSNSLLQAADEAARKLKNVPLVSQIRRRKEEVARLEKEFEKWQPYLDVLKKNSADPEANEALGTYYALVKGDWDRGLPLLAQAKNESLRELARRDLAEQKNRNQPGPLAELFLQTAQGRPEVQKNNLLVRSASWFQQALIQASSPEREKMERRLNQILDQLPPQLRIGEIALEMKKWDGHVGPAYSAAFSPDGRRAVSVGADGLVHLWDVRTGKEQRKLGGQASRLWCVAFSPDGRQIATGGFDGMVRLWDPATGQESRQFPGHADYVRGTAFTPDGKFLISVGDDKLIRIWDLQTGKTSQTLKGHDHFIWSVAVSRDGRRLLTGSQDRTARLWDWKEGKEIHVLKGHDEPILCVALSPDGRHGLTGSTDRTLMLWDLETGQPVKTFTGHQGYVYSAAFSPDGRRILSAGQDKTLRLWDVASGQEIRTLPGNGDQVWSVAFSRDGRWALSTGQDQSVRLWGPGR